MRVIGVGYGGTGTESLQEALSILGYAAFHSPKTMILKRPKVLDAWHNTLMLARTTRNPDACPQDLQDLLEGYTAATGMLFSVCFEKTLQVFPDATFILTKERSADDWFQSWSTMMDSLALLPRFAPWLPRQLILIDDYNRWLMAWIHGNNNDQSFYWMSSKHPLTQNAAVAKQSYLDHIEQVQRRVPEGRLLELEIGSGWEPLCGFLNVSIPVDTAYPHLHASQNVIWTCRGLVAASNLLLLLLVYIIKRIISKLTQIGSPKQLPDAKFVEKDHGDNIFEEVGADDNDDYEEYIPKVRILPEENQESNEPCLLSLPMMQKLAKDALPPVVSLRCWQRCYLLSRDGDDFGTFLNATKGQKQTLLVVQTTKGKKLGGFADSLWDTSERENYSISAGSGFYGSTQACLFTFESNSDTASAATTTNNESKQDAEEPQLTVFKWTGRNRFIQLFDVHTGRVAFGGGGRNDTTGKEGLPAFGLCMEDNFSRGTSAPNETFGNKYSLAGTENFAILDMEIWTFARGTLG